MSNDREDEKPPFVRYCEAMDAKDKDKVKRDKAWMKLYRRISTIK